MEYAGMTIYPHGLALWLAVAFALSLAMGALPLRAVVRMQARVATGRGGTT